MSVHHLDRGEGRLAYDERGRGPLVVCVPGMGDVRAEYRFLTPQLIAAGYRVVTLDLRGHGESDATFSSYERPAAGDDVVALLEHLDAGPAHLIGASYGAAAVVWAAAEASARVASVTLIGPFVRRQSAGVGARIAMELLLARPWGARAWSWWYTRLYPGRRPADLDDHVALLRRQLADPRRLAALRAMARSTCAEIDPRLDTLTAPVAVVMGSADPDFRDPAAEARAVAVRVAGEVIMVDGAGHYPHAEEPDVTGPAVRRFLDRVGATS
jgi:pimeloyl-ACP methyl ester carboxylesterase